MTKKSELKVELPEPSRITNIAAGLMFVAGISIASFAHGQEAPASPGGDNGGTEQPATSSEDITINTNGGNPTANATGGNANAGANADASANAGADADANATGVAGDVNAKGGRGGDGGDARQDQGQQQGQGQDQGQQQGQGQDQQQRAESSSDQEQSQQATTGDNTTTIDHDGDSHISFNGQEVPVTAAIDQCMAVTSKGNSFEIAIPFVAGFGFGKNESEAEYIQECAEDVKENLMLTLRNRTQIAEIEQDIEYLRQAVRVYLKQGDASPLNTFMEKHALEDKAMYVAAKLEERRAQCHEIIYGSYYDDIDNPAKAQQRAADDAAAHRGSESMTGYFQSLAQELSNTAQNVRLELAKKFNQCVASNEEAIRAHFHPGLKDLEIFKKGEGHGPGSLSLK